MGSSVEKKILYPVDKPEVVRTDLIDIIDYQYRTSRDIDIVIRQPEFTSVCPMTGLPDFGTILIKYRPDDKIVELKSLKYYLLQYRNVGIFYEHVVNRILDDLVAQIRPKRMEIIGEFTARGGITSTISAVYERDK
ncbi:MAG: preQ(1) synthase [Desulfobacterales bacterium]|jgi:7-cyano-7-deazaguanine reductase|nr:preQ(1) synthase [Desulfobacterales bacterium]